MCGRVAKNCNNVRIERLCNPLAIDSKPLNLKDQESTGNEQTWQKTCYSPTVDKVYHFS